MRFCTGTSIKPFALLLLVLVLAAGALANDYYTHTNFPVSATQATSAGMRNELDLVSAGFDKLPALSGNGNKAVIVNGGGTALTVTTGTLALAGNFAITGAYATTLTATGATNVTLPTTGTLATQAGSETLTNKTFNLSSNTLTGTTAQFNTALSDNDFATLAGSETLTNKTITAPIFSGTATGTYTLGGTPTLSAPVFSGTATGTYTLGGTPTLSSPTFTSGFSIGGNTTLSSAALGNNTAGRSAAIGRNTNGGAEGPAAGTLALRMASGSDRFLWVDASGNLRMHTAAPTGSSGSPSVSDTAGSVVSQNLSACNAGYTRVAPGFCLRDATSTYTALTMATGCTNQAGSITGTAPPNGSNAIILISATALSNNATGSRSNAVSWWDSSGCTNATDNATVQTREQAAVAAGTTLLTQRILQHVRLSGAAVYSTMSNTGGNGNVNFSAQWWGYYD